MYHLFWLKTERFKTEIPRKVMPNEAPDEILGKVDLYDPDRSFMSWKSNSDTNGAPSRIFRRKMLQQDGINVIEFWPPPSQQKWLQRPFLGVKMGPAWVHFSSLIPVGSGTAKTPRLAALLLMVILTGKLRHKTGCLVPPRGVSECDNTMHLVIPCLPSWHIIPIAPLADQKLEK